jgi:GcrA cell cycle regulator
MAEERHLSAREIAIELHVTRNTIIGLVHRVGIGLSRSSSRGGSKQPNKPFKVKPGSAVLRWALPNIVPDAPIPEPDVVPDRAIGIMELTQDKCRWPYAGSTATLYCGNKPVGGLPYCPSHARLAYAPVNKQASGRQFHNARRVSSLPKTSFPQVRRARLSLV